MAKVRTRFPRIFVGHPFKQRFPVNTFRAFFKELPFSVIYGNTDIETKHLLAVMKGNLNKIDYAIFDLSYWNPNVALELGLCEGLRKKPGKDYYILLNTNRAKDVPSDIRGIQRLEYTKYSYSLSGGLGEQLVLLLKKEYWPKKIYSELKRGESDTKLLPRSFIVALKIIAHLRDFDRITNDNLRKICKGTHLRQHTRDEVLQALKKLKLIRKERGRDVYIKQGKKLF